MKILVCISCVPDTTSKINFIEDNKEFSREGVQYVINPNDEFGLTRAMWIKEKDGSSIDIINVGTKSNEPILRKALAIGADRAYRINSEPFDSKFVAHNIAHFISEHKFDLILMGKESIDYNSGIVHYLTGSILGIQTFNPVSYLDIENNKDIIIKTEVESGINKIKANLPLILGCQEPIAEWKIPNMRGIMGARSKELIVINPTDYKPSLEYIKHDIPSNKKEIKYIDKENIDLLVDELKLKNL